MREAYPVWEGLHDALGEDSLFERQGNLKLIGREQDIGMAHAQAWMHNQADVETIVLDAQEVRELEPYVEDGIFGGILCPRDGSSDHTKTTRAYAAAAKREDVTIREETHAVAVVYRDGRATGVRLVDGSVVEASVGVLMLSNWSVADLLEGLVEIPVWSEALQVPNRNVISHTNRILSLKPEPGNRVMISGGYRGHYDRETHVGKAIQASIDANVADAVATYPSLAGIEIDVADAGHLESLTIDQVPECPNLWYGTGWCGHGWAIAPVVSELLAQFVTEGECPALLQPFALSRFG